MLPQIHFNFGGVAFDHLYQVLLLPFIPGAVLVGGFIIVRPELASSFVMVWGASPFLWFGVLAIAAYIIGWVSVGLSAVVTGFATGLLLHLSRKRKYMRDNQELSRRTNWRKVAEMFLGSELAPVRPVTLPLKSPEQIAASLQKNLDETMRYNAEWKDWYDILQDYLLRDVPRMSSDTMSVMVALEATGWAIVGLSIASPYARRWELYVVASLFIFLGIFAPIGAAASYLNSDRLTYWDFTGRLLAEVRAGGRPGVLSVEQKKSQET